MAKRELVWIPFFGWAFKTVERRIRKENLLVFLTPHIVRDPEHLEAETIKRRERFLTHTEMLFDETELEEDADYESGTRGVRKVALGTGDSSKA